MIATMESTQEQVTATQPSEVAMALFAAGRCVLHMDGLIVTCSIDGECVSGVVTDWADAVRLVDTAVSHFIQQYMADVFEPGMGALDLANDAARYFGIQDNPPVQLFGWARQVING